MTGTFQALEPFHRAAPVHTARAWVLGDFWAQLSDIALPGSVSYLAADMGGVPASGVSLLLKDSPPRGGDLH